MLSWIDVFAVIFLAYFVFQGAQRGVVRILLDIISVLLSIFAASKTYMFLISTVMPFARTTDKAGYVITFAILFAIFILALDLLVGALQKVVNIQFHGGVETLGGGALGFIKGVLIVGVIVQLLSLYSFYPALGEAVDRSMAKQLSLPTLRQTYSSIFGRFPAIDFFIQEKVIPATPKEVPHKP